MASEMECHLQACSVSREQFVVVKRPEPHCNQMVVKVNTCNHSISRRVFDCSSYLFSQPNQNPLVSKSVKQVGEGGVIENV